MIKVVYEGEKNAKDYMYKEMIKNFLRQDSMPGVTIAESLRVLDIVEKMRLSSETGNNLVIN